MNLGSYGALKAPPVGDCNNILWLMHCDLQVCNWIDKEFFEKYKKAIRKNES